MDISIQISVVVVFKNESRIIPPHVSVSPQYAVAGNIKLTAPLPAAARGPVANDGHVTDKYNATQPVHHAANEATCSI